MKKKPKAPRPWFFFISQDASQGCATYIPTTKMKKLKHQASNLLCFSRCKLRLNLAHLQQKWGGKKN
jgi:hypothetical protein